VYKRASIFFE
jgi:large subunit ribosomal protein L28